MNKIALFIIAALLATSAIAPIADCLLEDGASTGTVCLLCGAGKTTALAATSCATAAPTDCVFHGAAFTARGLLTNWCDVCAATKFSKVDGMCIAVANTTALVACGLKAATTSTVFECIGCDATAGILDIDPLVGCSATYRPAASTRDVNSATTLATITSCQPNSYQAASGACVVQNPAVTTNEQVFKPATGASKVYWVAATASAVNYVTGASVTANGAGSGCWFTDGVSCVKCRPDFAPKYETVGSAAPKTLKVTCTAWTAPTGTDRKCRASYMNASVEQCIKCADINGTLSDANANFTCAAANNSSNNTNATTPNNSSILGFSVAAFLLLIINRLF